MLLTFGATQEEASDGFPRQERVRLRYLQNECETIACIVVTLSTGGRIANGISINAPRPTHPHTVEAFFERRLLYSR